MSATNSESGRLVDFELHETRITEKTIWRFVTLHDNKGNTGHGEFSYDGAPVDILDQANAFISPLLGLPANGDSLADSGARLDFEDLMQATLFSAVEQALVEIEAKAVRLPLWRYLGGRNGNVEIPLYANINRRTVDRSPEGFAQSAADAVASGFSWIKIAPFDGVTPQTVEGDITITEGLARIKAVRSVIGDRFLMVDCHWRFSADRTMSLMGELSASQICWLECPIVESENQLDAMIAIRNSANANGMQLAGLESFAGWEQFRPYVEAGAYDVVMPDIKHCGGHRAFQEIAKNTAIFGVGVSAHNPSGPVAHLASLHATAAIGAPEPMEIQFDESLRFFELTGPSPPAVSGRSKLPSGVGLGARLATSTHV